MRKYIFIAAGGVLGAILRYSIEELHTSRYNGGIPLNTLAINTAGSFLLAFILTLAFEVWEFNSDIRLGITTGFLGAFTTFSTFCKETVGLIRGGDIFSATVYIILSTVLGLAAAYLGIVLVRSVAAKLLKKDKTGENAEDEIEGGVE